MREKIAITAKAEIEERPSLTSLIDQTERSLNEQIESVDRINRQLERILGDSSVKLDIENEQPVCMRDAMINNLRTSQKLSSALEKIAFVLESL